MTPAALVPGAIADRLRAGGRLPMSAAGDDTAWRTLVVFSAYRVVLALGLSGAYAFLNTFFQLGIQQPGLAVTTLVTYAVASVLLVVPALLREPRISLQVTAAVFVDVMCLPVPWRHCLAFVLPPCCLRSGPPGQITYSLSGWA